VRDRGGRFVPVFNGNGVVTITVTDESPYRCLGGPPCAPEGKNDCNHNGSLLDSIDDNDCDNNGTPDVPVRAFSVAEPAGEWVILNRVPDGSSNYRGTLPIALGSDVAGVLFVNDQAGLNNDITVRYTDEWDGSPSGSNCANNADPAKRGIVDQPVDLIVSDKGKIVVTQYRVDSTSLSPTNDGDGYPDTNELVNLYVTV
jgi:hypothetical protein